MLQSRITRKVRAVDRSRQVVTAMATLANLNAIVHDVRALENRSNALGTIAIQQRIESIDDMKVVGVVARHRDRSRHDSGRGHLMVASHTHGIDTQWHFNRLATRMLDPNAFLITNQPTNQSIDQSSIVYQGNTLDSIIEQVNEDHTRCDAQLYLSIKYPAIYRSIYSSIKLSIERERISEHY